LKYHVFGGGTVSHIRPHLALSVPAYGGTARRIVKILHSRLNSAEDEVHTVFTRMASRDSLTETNADVEMRVRSILEDPSPAVIFFNVAMCDFEVAGIKREGFDSTWGPGLDFPRLRSSEDYDLRITAAEKLIRKIRQVRKDIFLVGFKATAGAEPNEMFRAGLHLLKGSSCNLVLANDIRTGRNMIITPEVAPYDGPKPFDRQVSLETLVDMAIQRSGLTFHPTDMLQEPFLEPLMSLENAPAALRHVVQHCVSRGAYKAFEDVTVGHYGWRESFASGGYVDFSAGFQIPERLTMWSSRRKQNFNTVEGQGMVKVEVINDYVMAHGEKPSAGARSQALLFREHAEYDCIVHFHCPMKYHPYITTGEVDDVPRRSQRSYECGSKECGINTSSGMKDFAEYGVAAVMLDKHGPNILFRSDGDPEAVIAFIDRNFDLEQSTSLYL
jgi:hypothetical protein